MNINKSLTIAVAVAGLYQASAAVFVTNTGSLTATGGSANNTAISFQVTSALTVGSLGAYVPGGFSGDTLTVSLWQGGASDPFASSSAALASTVISSGTPDSTGYVYAGVSSVSLVPGTFYAITVSGRVSTQNGNAADNVPTFNLVSTVLDLVKIGGGDFTGNPFAGGNGIGFNAINVNTTHFNSGSFSTAAVPEPETYAMLAGLGLVGFGLYRRCRQ